ncbi:MAG: TldD/PmbA family protein [Clostridiales bacterium]
MKVNLSVFLEETRPIARQLVDELLKTYTYVSLLGADSMGKRYMVKKTGVDINDARFSERGFVLRVHNSVGYMEYAFNELSIDKIPEIISKINEKSNYLKEQLKNANLVQIKYEKLIEDSMKKDFNEDVAILPENISYKDKLAKMRDIMEKTFDLSDELIDVRVIYEEMNISKIFISKEKDLSQAYIWSNTYIIPIASKNSQVKYIHLGSSGLKGVEILDELYDLYEDSIKQLNYVLNAKTIEPGEYDVILNPEVSGLVAHEAFGHGVEMDMFVKGRANAVHYLNKAVASKLVNMYDGAASAREVSSYFFDDEGVIAGDTKIIDKGIFKTGISDNLSAERLGIKSTGNGKRQTFEHKAYSRMTNTFFGEGNNSLESMIASIDYGFLLESFNSGMEDPKNWGIQCVISRGREIKNGKFTDKVFAPIIMTGYVPDLLKSISMVSKGVELSGSGYCGKGYKEFVKTSIGGPYIKARGKLS